MLRESGRGCECQFPDDDPDEAETGRTLTVSHWFVGFHMSAGIPIATVHELCIENHYLTVEGVP
jgi:hypothetical protein